MCLRGLFEFKWDIGDVKTPTYAKTKITNDVSIQ
jgi:hypothetical protein